MRFLHQIKCVLKTSAHLKIVHQIQKLTDYGVWLAMIEQKFFWRDMMIKHQSISIFHIHFYKFLKSLFSPVKTRGNKHNICKVVFNDQSRRQAKGSEQLHVTWHCLEICNHIKLIIFYWIKLLQCYKSHNKILQLEKWHQRQHFLLLLQGSFD